MSAPITASPHFALHRRLIVGRARHVPPEDVVEAWLSPYAQSTRPYEEPIQYTAAGYTRDGVLLELIAQDASAYRDPDGNPLRMLFHAMPATRQFLRELNVSEHLAEQ